MVSFPWLFFRAPSMADVLTLLSRLPTGWGGISINKANAANFQNCSFGIVSGMENGDVVYSGGITGPSLFAGGPATGKTLVNNVDKLTFRRAGDTYTLTSAGSGKTAGGLDRFQQMEGWAPSGKPKPIRYYNSFWPMDMAETWGADGHDIKFGGNGKAEQRHGVGIGENKTLPKTDNNGPDHNSYFGMTFELTFDLPNDYVGPLEYYFFGDDDMWVFLDGKLVCDIGGVHTAVGEYVDLWDYIGEPDREPADCTSGAAPEANSTKHTLTFFYVERGASGSTCWMQYTLPNAVSVPVSDKPTDPEQSLRIEKKVEGNLEVDPNMEYTFSIILTGNMNEKFQANRYDADGKHFNSYTVSCTSETEFKLKAGEYLIVSELPERAGFELKELLDGEEYDGIRDDCYTTIDITTTKDGVSETQTVEGTSAGTNLGGGSVLVTVTNGFNFELPETGGNGTLLYTLTGALLPAVTGGLWYRKRKSKGEGAVD